MGSRNKIGRFIVFWIFIGMPMMLPGGILMHVADGAWALPIGFGWLLLTYAAYSGFSYLVDKIFSDKRPTRPWQPPRS
jgi:hypothetical protein